MHDRRVESVFKDLLQAEVDVARLGAVSRGGRVFVPALLQKPGAELTPEQRKRVAFALGGILHFPADQILKPLMSELAHAEWNREHHAMQTGESGSPSIREISAYYDVEVFRNVYLTGQETPFNQFLLATNDTLPGLALEGFVRALFQRALLSAHTLSPDLTDPGPWVDRLVALVQPLYLNIELYTRVFQDPDPAKQLAYAVRTQFFVAQDPVNRLARAAQLGGVPEQSELDAAILNQANEGGYGQAVALGMRALREASEFWQGLRADPPDVSQG
jgi:hypothetical protein